jgi:hypothetical protein
MLPAAFIAAFLTAGGAAGPPQPPKVFRPAVWYAYQLTDYQGEIGTSFASVTYDREHDELFVVRGQSVGVFREGLRIDQFKLADEIGTAAALAVLGESGDLLILSVTGKLFRCNYRGRMIAPLVPVNVPPRFEGMTPAHVQVVKDRIYLLDRQGFRALVLDLEGKAVAAYDLEALVFNGKVPENREIRGFSVDPNGNLLFTIPASFKAYVVSADGKVREFGTPGSRPGKFNVVGPIIADENGIVYVGDLLRSVVMLFDPDLKFLAELGGRGRHQGSLAVPSFLAAGNGYLFVSQGGKRGVNVYNVRPN